MSGDSNDSLFSFAITKEKLNYPGEQTLLQRAAFQYTLKVCQEKYKEDVGELLLNMGIAYGYVLLEINNVLSRKFHIEYVPQSDSDSDGYDGESMAKRDILELAKIYIPMIEEWIAFMDKNVFYDVSTPPVAFLELRYHRARSIDFLNLVVFNNRGKINYGQTAKRLIAETDISMENKLKIACLHCLTDEIANIIGRVRFPKKFPGAPKPMKKLMRFWRDFKFKRKYSAGKAESLIHFVGYENYHAVRFFWHKLTEKRKHRAIVNIFRRSKAELQCWWLHEMTGEQQKYVLSLCGHFVLINLLDHKVFCFFNTAMFAREVMSGQQYLEVMKAAASRIHHAVCDPNLIKFQFMWKLAPQHAKDYIYAHEESLNFFEFLKRVRNYEFFEKFFERAPAEYKRKFLNSEIGMEVCAQLTSSPNFVIDGLFHDLIEMTYPEDEQMVEYKIELMNEQFAAQTLDEYFENNDKESFDKTLCGIFDSQKDATKYKKQFLYNSKGHRVMYERTRSTFFTDVHTEELRPELDFSHIVEYIRWFLTDEEIETYKKSALCRSKDVVEVFLALIKMNRCDLVDEFLKWSFDDDQLMANYKQTFYDDRLKKLFIGFAAEMILKKDNLESWRKFDDWCGMLPENRRQFGDAMVACTKEYQEMLMPMWRYVLKPFDFELMDELMNRFGYDDQQRLKHAKEKLFTKLQWIYLIFGKWRSAEVYESLSDQDTLNAVRDETEATLRWFLGMNDSFEELLQRGGLMVDDE